MKIHEYQAKALFQQYGIPIPQGSTGSTAEEIFRQAEALKKTPLVLKAQIHAGGRGKEGGIRVVRDAALARSVASELIGSRLVTPQTGQEGRSVDHLLVEETLDVERELYLGITMDRLRECPVLLCSAQGGMDIEKLAAGDPGKIIMETVNPVVGLRPFQANRVFYALGLDPSFARPLTGIMMNLYRLFVEKDCSLAEINPLVITKGRAVAALDAKLNFDDNALYRHPDIAAMRDISQENLLEVEASRYNLNYIKLKGNVGCMVNGAGLAMATMDLIKLAGAEPANFLDVGGGATSEMVSRGLQILLSDVDVRVIFINIFGGILRCDTLARGVVDAARQLKIDFPMVIRLEGTNVERGREILAESGLSFTVARGMAEAADEIGRALQESRD
jgi:succinyl-CoA synthetase beta subunit